MKKVQVPKTSTSHDFVDNISAVSADAETTSNPYQKIVPFILFVGALLLLFALVRPMITILLGSILLAYITYPLYTRIRSRTNRKNLSISMALAIVVVIVLVPFAFLTFEITRQGYYFYESLSTSIRDGAVFGLGCVSTESQLCSLLNQFEQFSAERLSGFGIDVQLQKLLPLLEEKITLFIISIPIIIASVFLTIVLAFFILAD